MTRMKGASGFGAFIASGKSVVDITGVREIAEYYRVLLTMNSNQAFAR